MAAALARNRQHHGQTALGVRLSPLEKRTDWLPVLIVNKPDLTLDEVVAAMRNRGIAGSGSAVWRFFARHRISFKKACAQRSKSVPTWPAHAGAGCESRACLIRPG